MNEWNFERAVDDDDGRYDDDGGCLAVSWIVGLGSEVVWVLRKVKEMVWPCVEGASQIELGLGLFFYL